MRVPNGTTVLVADGSKMLLLENRGEAFDPKLHVIEQLTQTNLSAHELSTDRPGRAFASIGSGRSAMEETDQHELAEDRFAIEVAERLREHSRKLNGAGVIVIAPPRTLGKLRQHYQGDLQNLVVAEIAKDLTGHPVNDIARLISEYEA